jgi:hypothetical protein
MGACRFWVVVLALLALDGPVRAAAVVVPPACAASDDYVTPDEKLYDVAAALRAGGPLNVLAIGSATTVGQRAANAHPTAPGTSFPYRMADALRAAMPQVQVQLTVRGGRGLTADAMLPLLQQALKGQHYQLVLWQTGTIEAVRGLRPDLMQDVLQDGIELAQRSGANVVLIDSQFSRFLRANADLDPYELVMQQAATMPGVVLFHRFDLMRDWVHDGRIDLENTSRNERAAAIALLNTCLGATLARFVQNGAAMQ